MLSIQNKTLCKLQKKSSFIPLLDASSYRTIRNDEQFPKDLNLLQLVTDPFKQKKIKKKSSKKKKKIIIINNQISSQLPSNT